MRYRSLGRSGVKVSEVSIGTGGQFALLDEETIKLMVGNAIDAGINYFDTANIYPVLESSLGGKLAEQKLGSALQGHRHEVVLGTKGMQATGPGPNERGASRYNLMNALEDSLRRLRTDHVDLYQVHLFDTSTPMDETMRTLEDMVSSGKVRYVGASQYQAWQICRCNDLAEHYGWARFVSAQAHYHLLERDVERELVPFCRSQGVGLLPYFPLANGLLGGRYRAGREYPEGSRPATFERTRRYLDQYATPGNLARIDRLSEFAAQRGHALPDLAISWLLAEPVVSSVITGVSKAEQVIANARASEWKLAPEELAELRVILGDGADH